MLTLFLLGACRLFVRDEVDPFEELLAQVDRAWEARADPAALDESVQLSLQALAERPDAPAALWRLSRSWGALAWSGPGTQAEALYQEARTFGMECLLTSTGFSSRVSVAGGRVVPRAVKQVAGPQRPCLGPILVAWVRWVEQRGPSAALDLEAIRLLAERAMELDEAGEAWEGPWARAMVEVLRPGPSERDTALARELLARAIQAEPGLAVAHLDLARYTLVLGGAEAEWRTELRRFDADHPAAQDGPWALENGVARLRAREALDQGPEAWAPRW